MGLERAPLDNEETANERLIRKIDERLKLSEQCYAECEQQKQVLEGRLNVLGGTVIRLSAALDIQPLRLHGEQARRKRPNQAAAKVRACCFPA